LLTALLAAGLVWAAVPATAHFAPQPKVIAGNPNCTTVKSAGAELKYDPVWKGTVVFTDKHGLPKGTSLAVTISHDRKSASFKADGLTVSDVLVKGGPAANHYKFNPSTKAGASLTTPKHNKNVPDISHVTFCYLVDVKPTHILKCGVQPAVVTQQPLYEVVLRDCQGTKSFFGSSGIDAGGNQFVELKPVPGQGSAQFLEKLVFQPEKGMTQNSKTLYYDDFVGLGEREMPFCKSDPRPNEKFELVANLKPGNVLPGNHTSCIVESKFKAGAGGVGATYIIYSFADGLRTFK